MKTHERFALSAWVPSWIRHQHLTRYQWACEFAKDKHVVDAACGTGYGSAMLARAGAASVRGFDLSDDAVSAAARDHVGDNLTFAQGDVTQLPLAAHSVDLFVCFETIEHVPNDRGVIAEAARILRPGGLFLCSSPHRVLTNPGTSLDDAPFNPHHVREYLHEELDARLRERFTQIEWYGQSIFSPAWAGWLGRIAARTKAGAVKAHQLRKAITWPLDRIAWHEVKPAPWPGIPEFLIACCRAE